MKQEVSRLSAAEKYIIITLSDMKLILAEIGSSENIHLSRIKSRFESETGADILDIATLLKRTDVCAACSIEGQAHNCKSLISRKLGRRLYRLLLRANYITGETE